MTKSSPFITWSNPRLWRTTIQWLFFGWCLFLGVQFGLFVRHFETAGQTAYYPRLPGVEGFLPIGALVSLKAWLLTGRFDPVHPAALVLFLTFLAMAFLTRKSFCSFLCPVGTLSEGAWRLGQQLFGRNFQIWRGLDWIMRLAKYTLLAFFAKLVLLDMPVMALRGFLASPYWAVADVKMLHFFTDVSKTALMVMLVLGLLSLFYRNFWCRYLCPYGALLGLLGLYSHTGIRRNRETCTGCGICSRNCPARIDIRNKQVVRSAECSACLTCVTSCPQPGTLSVSLWKRPLPASVFIGAVLLIFSTGILTGILTGHWDTSLTYGDYQRLIPAAPHFGH